jgi:hypothetical protein
MSLSPPPLPIPPLGRYKARGVDEAQRRREEEEGERAAGTVTGSRGRGASSGAAGEGDAWGPDNRTADAPLSRFREGGLSSCPQAIIVYPWTAMARTVGIRSRRVKGVISWYHFEATPLLDSETSCNFCDWLPHPHPQSAGTTKSQRRVGTRKRPPPKKNITNDCEITYGIPRN